MALAIICLLAPGAARAQFLFVTNNGSISITGYTGPGGNVVIPSTTNGFPVTSIAANAFSLNFLSIEINRLTGPAIITNVMIPGSITNIGTAAFSRCTGLAGVTMMSGVATIGDSAFSGCTNLTSLAMSNGVTSIGSGTFSGCTKLAVVGLPGTVAVIGFNAFLGCMNLANLTIPGSVISIGSGAFSQCSKLTSALIPSGVSHIGSGVFEGCNALTNILVDSANPNYIAVAGVLFDKAGISLIEYPGGKAGSYVIPGGVSTIGDQAFEDCAKLASVTIPTNVTYIGSQAFAACSNLAAITIPSSVTGLGYGVFSQCTKLTTISFPNSITGIWYSECFGCASLTTVTIGSGVEMVAPNAFGNCPRLLMFTVSAGNTNYLSLNGVLFNKSMTTLELFPAGKGAGYTIPGTVTAIADQAFENCAKLPSVLIPNSVKSIGFYTFYGCSSLTNLTIPNSVTSLGPSAIQACSNLTAVTIGSGVTNIGFAQAYGYGFFGGQFNQCPRLASIAVDAHNPDYSSTNGILFDKAKTTLLQYPQAKSGSYTLPNSVVNIADNAFEGCTGLKSVTIPNSVTNLGNGTFADCTSLTNVNFGTGITSLEYDFSDCTNLARVFFPGNSPTSFYYMPFANAHPTLYYLPGTSGWDSFSSYAGVPTVMLNAPSPAGSLWVSIMPWEAATAGAQWQVDGGILQPAGATVGGLTVGQHTVSFTPISGWITPTNEIVVVSSNSTASATGYYSATGDAAFICATNSDNTLTIIQYAGQGGDVTIPTAINGLLVTGIGDDAFNNYSSLTGVTIPGSVGSVGNWAFSGCNNLAGVTMTNGLAAIGFGAFQNCIVLTNLTIPGSVTNIGDDAFDSCPALASVTISDGVTSIGAYAFSQCANLTSIAVPGSASIGDFAFSYCYGLTNALISNGVCQIGNDAFYDTALINVTVPGSVTNIGDEAFAMCFQLVSVILSNGVTCIGNHTFENCSQLTAIEIPASVTNMGPLDFFYCYALTNLAVDAFNAAYAGVGGVLFDKNLTQLIEYPQGKTGRYNIPGSVARIGDGAFEGCYSLSGITIPGSVTSIGSAAFENCGDLPSVQIPGGVTSIGDAAFSSCWSLTNFTVDVFNSSYASADGVLFDKPFTTLIQCPPAKTGGYAVPAGVISIAASAFEYCARLTNVIVANSVTSIGQDAFANCSKLVSVTIPGSVANIENDAFQGCSRLADVTLPYGVTSIGDYAFGFCCQLANIAIPDSVNTIGDSAFYECTSLTNIMIPEGVNHMGDDVFAHCSHLTGITIPASVTNLGYYAFGYCTNLTQIFDAGNAPTLVGGLWWPSSSDPFHGDSGTVYHLPGTAGWTNTFGGLPTALWYQPNPLILENGSGPGLQNKRFGFTIAWATNVSVVVEACTNLSNPVWRPVQTNALVNGTNYFSDAKWTNYPGRFYRVRSP